MNAKQSIAIVVKESMVRRFMIFLLVLPVYEKAWTRILPNVQLSRPRVDRRKRSRLFEVERPPTACALPLKMGLRHDPISSSVYQVTSGSLARERGAMSLVGTYCPKAISDLMSAIGGEADSLYSL